MRLLEFAFPRLSRLVPSGRYFVGFIAAALVVALELVGRLTQNDVHDGLAASALVSAVALAFVRNKTRPWPGSGFARRRLVRLFEHVRGNYGVDLRGTPPLPPRTPSGAWMVLLGLLAWTALAGSVWWLCPQGWRDLGVNTSYVVYLVLLSLLWTALLVVLMGTLFLTFTLIDRHVHPGGRKTQERRAVELLVFFGYIAVVIALANLVPVVAVVGLCGAVAVAALGVAAFSPADTQAVLWRSRPGRPVYSVPQQRIVAGLCALAAILVGNLLLSACGGRLLTMPDKADPMLMTDLIGASTAWMVPGFVVVAAFTLWKLRAADPANRTPLTLHWTTALPVASLKGSRLLSAQGWRIRGRGDRRRPGDVAVVVVPPEESEAFEFQPAWPLKVSLRDLDNPDVIDRLARRDGLQLRRRAYRGLRTMLRRAYGQKKHKGGYYRFAPHWWHSGALTYEEPPRRADGLPTARRVGPWYAVVFRPRVRQQFHAMLRAVEIDEVIVDDGVPSRAVERVVRALFEIYDKHDGRRRAEDHLFRLIPRVRTIIHECQPDVPRTTRRRETGFDETQYVELCRARVLHVFKDDGESDLVADVPYDSSWEPAPSADYR